MAVYRRIGLHIIGFICYFISKGSHSFGVEIGMRNIGITQLTGSVISTPCSINLSSRYQTIDFSYLTIAMLSTSVTRDNHIKPFYIELQNCGSNYTVIDSKSWIIRFEGQNVMDTNAILLQGPSEGVAISILDSSQNVLTLNKNYLLFNNLDALEKGINPLRLRYFLRMKLTGKSMQPGSYQGLVIYSIDYQ